MNREESPSDTMPATHNIDNTNKRIITKWHGEPTASEMIDAYRAYLKDVRNKSEFTYYDEILDLTAMEGFKLSTEGLTTLGEIAAKADTPGVVTRLAIVVSSTLTYGLARMYTIYRSFIPKGNKKIEIFRNQADAVAWLDKQRNR